MHPYIFTYIDACIQTYDSGRRDLRCFVLVWCVFDILGDQDGFCCCACCLAIAGVDLDADFGESQFAR